MRTGAETPHGTIHTIVNYNTYAAQADAVRDTLRDTTRDSSGTAAGQEQEGKKLTSNKKPTAAVGAKAKRQRQRQRPKDWEPTETHRVKAKEKSLDLDEQAEKFMTYHDSKGNIFVDWDLAFHTWLGNAQQYSRSNGGPPGVRVNDEAAELEAKRNRIRGSGPMEPLIKERVPYQRVKSQDKGNVGVTLPEGP